MGKGLVKTESHQFICLIEKWAKNHNFSLKYPNQNNQEVIKFKAKKSFAVAIWQFQSVNGSIAVNMILRLRLYLNIIIHALLFACLLHAINTANNLLMEYTYPTLFQFIICAILVILIIWWKDNRLSLKLLKLENSFWDITAKSCDIKQLTRSDGQIHNKESRLFTEVVLAIAVVYTCTLFLGLLGFAVSSLICTLILLMIFAEIKYSENQHWNWRFWIMSNMATWTFLIIATLAIPLVIISLEVFLPLELYKDENTMTMRQAIQQGQFREIKPATAKLLEENSRKYFYGLSKINTSTPEDKLDKRKKLYLYCNCSVFLLIIVVGVCFFILKPLINLFQKQNIWRNEINKKHFQDGPFVPYLPNAWSWQIPAILRVLVLLHCLIGGIINLAATTFCLDSLSYMIIGKSVLFEKVANLWSWIFASAKILFGNTMGKVTGSILIIIVNFAVIMLLLTNIRRVLGKVILVIRILLAKLNKKHSNQITLLNKYIKQICLNAKMKSPIIVLTKNKNITIKVFWLPLRNAVIEVSCNALKILNEAELKAAIAHELGHIKQGLWKIELLKLFSSLLFFPNYYLTLCVNWARNEINADQFALEATKDAQSLKNALIKISTAQISYLNNSQKESSNIFISKTIKMWHSAYISVRFFFGDSLLGYAHPYLSERLGIIDSSC